MDCCNYMQYRHPYYGPPFYENGLYNRDYYGHPYQSYYANSHYYSQPWPCAASFPDYVYNPKEARIRKAMREASRERVVGAAPIPSPRGGRRSQTWTSSPEEQLMMAPSPEMGGPLCSSPIFPGPTSSVGQFMQPINSYAKLVHVLPTTGWLQDSPTYLQHNPIAELQQHQANMWQQYQEPIRHCTGPTYMLDSQINLYQEVNPNDVLPQKKCKSEVETFSSNSSGSDAETAPPPKSEGEKAVKNEKMEENKEAVDDAQTLVDSGNIEQTETFLPVFQETVVVQNPFDKDDDMKLKKDSKTTPENPLPDPKPSQKLPSETKPSSTTSGGSISSNAPSMDHTLGFYLTPPECPLAEPIPSDSNPGANCQPTFKNCGCCGACRRNPGEEKFDMGSCNYVGFPFSTPLFHDPCNLDMLLMDNCNSNLIYTDVGVIPMYDNNSDVERLLHNISNIPGSSWRGSENGGSNAKANNGGK